MTPPRPATSVTALAAGLGLLFSGWSTADFVQHLDRQVHAIHCSFVPGLAAADASGASGCHVALMSTWSSVLRDTVWGGIPVSLPGMAVFAYLLWRAIDAWLTGRERDRDLTAFTVAAWALPVLTSIFFGYIAIVTLETFCRTCAGIYGSSALGFAAAVYAAWAARQPAPVLDEDDGALADEAPLLPAQSPMTGHVIRFGEGVVFVAVPIGLYLAMAPDFSGYLGTCGELPKPDDTYGVLVPIGPRGGTPAIEVLDPLCPACAGMEERLEASGLAAKLSRQAVLFPLDNACNWMINSAIHPGACVVSEAVLCSKDPEAVLGWAFEHGDEVRKATAEDAGAAKRMVLATFPELEGCVGTAETRQRLNRSLRWTVANELPILTPQLYVDNVKVCDDDTDLGLDWALSRLVARHGGGR